MFIVLLSVYYYFAFFTVEVCGFIVFPSNTNLWTRSNCGERRQSCNVVVESFKKPNDDAKVPDSLTKASWYAVEAFGNVFGGTSGKSIKTLATDEPPNSITETQERLRIDNERCYFLSGTVDELIYSESCIFSDPFVSFTGRDRFVKNLANLGAFITDYSAKPLDYSVNDNIVVTKFMVKLQLNLPWKPVLAWPWGVLCEIDPETNLIVLHQESVGTMTCIIVWY